MNTVRVELYLNFDLKFQMRGIKKLYEIHGDSDMKSFNFRICMTTFKIDSTQGHAYFKVILYVTYLKYDSLLKYETFISADVLKT